MPKEFEGEGELEDWIKWFNFLMENKYSKSPKINTLEEKKDSKRRLALIDIKCIDLGIHK